MRKLKLFFACLLMAVLSIGQVWADTAPTTFANKSTGTWAQNKSPLPCEEGGLAWNASADPSQWEGGTNDRGIQWTSGSIKNTSFTITNTSLASNTISSVSIVASTNSNANLVHINVTVGSTDFGTQNMPKANDQTFTFPSSGTKSASGNIVVTISGDDNSNTKSFYLKSITVTYSSGGQQTVATPTFSVAEGTYHVAQSVTISCGTSDASIYYTTNGGTPSTSSTPYGGAISLNTNGTTTIRAIAAKSGMTTSSEASATYTIALPRTVTLDAEGGTCTETSVAEEAATYGTVTLPEASPSTDCDNEDWTFAGWATATCTETTSAPTLYQAGSYNPANGLALYAVYKKTTGGSGSTDESVSKTANELATGKTISAGSDVTCYTSLALNDDITMSTDGTPNCGSFWVQSSGSSNYEWRLYRNKGGNIKITAADDCELSSVTVTFAVGNSGTLLRSGNAMTSGQTYAETGTSVTYTIGNSNSDTNGQIKVRGISVSYTKSGGGTTTYNSNPSCTPPTACANPTFNHGTGTYNATQSVTLSCTTADATIKYTTNGDTPDENHGTVYNGETITVDKTMTIKAYAYKSGMSNSEVAEAIYTLKPLTPTITKDVTHFLNTAQVTIACETAGVAIHYTTNGNEPTASSPTYTAPFNIDATTTVKAIAVKTNWDDSEIASETFTKATITSVADALEVIAGLNDGATTEEFYYVSGVIFGNPEIELTLYYNATYTIKDEDVDNSLTVFRGKYINNVDFESVDQLLAGDEVLVYGQLQKYKSGNVITPEVKNSYIITLDRPAIPSLVVDPTIIDFGTVMQGTANIENQDITVYFEHLTGDVDYVGEIAPFSASGTIAATGNKITISANASTVGNYTKTLTVRSEADGLSVDVTIKMNVTEPTGTFKLFSGELVEGEYVICSGTTAMKNVATSSPRIDAAEVDVDDVNKEIVNPDASVVWELKALTGDDAGYWTFYNKAVNKYAAFTGTDARGNIIAEVTDYAKFNHVSETAYEFQNKGKTGKNLRYNAGYGFASYGTGTGVALTLYKKPASSVVTIENSTNGVVSVTDANQEAVNNGESIAEGATLTVAVEEKAGYRFTPKAYKTGDATKTVTITEGVLTMPAYPITITTDELALYQIAIAVNDDAMGSASINGGADAIYVDGDDEITLVATANPGYEFVHWTVSDDNIGLDDEDAATTTALAGASGTITANFQEQVCDNLDAPTLNDAVSTSYTTATIAWNAVEHADGYVLNITQGSTAVVTNELIVAPEVSYEATGLSDGKTYHFTIMAIGDGAEYCDENNELLEGEFTTLTYPSVAVTYSENGHSVAGGSKKIMTPFALPEEVSHICTKEFVGWTTEDYKDYDAADKPAVFYNPGDNFTIESEAAITLYAVYAEVVPGSTTWDEITDEPTAGDYAICTSSYFLKAAISSGRFANGDATPAISGTALTKAPAEDCIWEISKNADNKFLIKNGDYYAAGTGVNNKGQLIDDATDPKAQWTITYSEGFVVTNVYNADQEVNATLKNNSNNGWACYASNFSGSAPRFFKKNVTEGYTSNYSTTCVEPEPEIALTPNTELAFDEVNQYDVVAGQDVAIELINVASVTIAIEGDGASAFGIDKTALDANGTVTVTPVTTISGTYSATLIVRDDDANGADAQSIALSIQINAGEAPAWSAKWVVAQELYDGMPVLITGINGSETYAMGAQGNNNRAAVLASVDANGALTPGEGTKQFTLEAIDAEHNKYAIKTSDGNYLYAASSGSNHLKTQDHIDGNATWTLSATSAIAEESSNRNVMQFNSSSTLFACYASASQAGIKLYTPQTYTRTVSGNYGTICLPNGGILTNGALYEVAYYDNASNKIFFDEVLNGEMKAGMPYIFLPNEGVTELKVVYTDSKNKTQAASADEANGLVGNLGSTITLSAGDYFLYNNQYYVVSASETRTISVPQYYAYINMSYVPDYPTAPAPGRRRVSMNVNGEQVATGVESIQPSEVSIQKVLINGELFILRGEKMYDATGRLVK